MILGKLICGLWLLRFDLFSHISFKKEPLEKLNRITSLLTNYVRKRELSKKLSTRQREKPSSHLESRNPGRASEGVKTNEEETPRADPIAGKPISLYPGAMLGWAMVARGEIGFLISSIAESNGIWRMENETDNNRDVGSSSNLFITVTWAIFLCTFIGPIMFGLIVRRVKRVEKVSGSERRNVLGTWGVEDS
jgi:hypothetical protein